MDDSQSSANGDEDIGVLTVAKTGANFVREMVE